MSYASDNHVLGFPARMSDGRQFTDFRGNCIMNNNVSMKSTSWLLRQDLIQNATDYKRFELNGLDSNMKNLLVKRIYDIAAVTKKNIKVSFNNTVLPIKNYQRCEPTGCTYSENTGYGIGYGRI